MAIGHWSFLPTLLLTLSPLAHAATLSNNSGLTVILDDSTGNYAISSHTPEPNGWLFSGSLRHPLKNLHTTESDPDSPLASHTLTADLSDNLTLSIQLFDDQPTVLFSWTTKTPADPAPRAGRAGPRRRPPRRPGRGAARRGGGAAG
ncbi:MAG: hypothetical protein ACTHN5_03985, partial [Phycisphaerae bacterium]